MTEAQEQALKALGHRAVLELCHHLIDNSADLIELAIHRAATLGVKEYGDISYHKEIEHLEVEVDAELADAIFYLHIILLKRIAAKQAPSDRGR